MCILSQSMAFLNCSEKRSPRNCCSRAVNNELDSCDHIYTNLIEFKSRAGTDIVNFEPVTIASTNKCNEDFGKKHTPTGLKIFAHRSSPVFAHKMNNEFEEAPREVMCSSYRSLHDTDFRCPRCGRRMDEPRLLPCLHPICLLCVYELMNKSSYIPSESERRDHQLHITSSSREMCALCDSYLPNFKSTVPPPHYPLQHRLVMDAVRRQLVNKILCDTCAAEVLAVVQCSTCLRNFCLKCGRQHEQQNIIEARTSKHLMRPLWEVTKIRRTIQCQTHPMHALRFYCIACRQVACKECMWSVQHRGHATEDAIGVGKRASVYLTMMLQKAKMVLNRLLTRYDFDVFLDNSFEELQNMIKTCRYVCTIQSYIFSYFRTLAFLYLQCKNYINCAMQTVKSCGNILEFL